MSSFHDLYRQAVSMIPTPKPEPKARTPLIPIETCYTSLPVDIPDSFLAPLPDPSTIKVNQIDFANSPLPMYKDVYAVILDNVLSQEECDQLIHMTEMSAGAHRGGENEPENNGWKPAMVNVGNNMEVLHADYRNSDRIIWDQKEITRRLWERVLQGEGMKDYLLKLEGEKYDSVFGPSLKPKRGERWVAAKQGINERMRFLKYGAGQFFRSHCDGAYVTPDGSQRTFFTVHLYLNDSAQELGIPEPAAGDTNTDLVDSNDKPARLLRGGATTLYSPNQKQRMDVDPKAGRVLIFQHRKLLHSGDDVKAGVKYTMRSDILYEFEGGSGPE